MPSLEDALSYTRHGRAIFPCESVLPGGGCSCGSMTCASVGKHPRYDGRDLRHGCLEATTDVDLVTRWWTRYPNANIGLPTGSRWGEIILDADVRDGRPGLESLERFRKDFHLPETFSVRTGSGGEQPRYRIGPLKIPSLRQGWHPDYPGLELKGENGYGMGPPSRNDRGVYEWAMKLPVAPAPAELIRLLRSRNPGGQKPRIEPDEWTRTVPIGQIDDYLTRMAGMLIRSKMPTAEVIRDIERLYRENCERGPNGHRRNDFERIVYSCTRMERARCEALEREEARREPYYFWTWPEIMDRPGIPWVLPGILQQGGYSVLYGGSNSGKTFLALDLALCTALGVDCWGMAPARRRTIYVAAEGEEGIPSRIHAWKAARGLQDDRIAADSFRVVLEPAPVAREGELSRFVQDLRHAWPEFEMGLIVLDTLGDCFTGNENATEDMAHWVRTIKKLALETHSTVLMIHHTGKNEANGARGSNGLRGGANGMFAVEQTPWGLILSCDKQRNGPHFSPIEFEKVGIEGSVVMVRKEKRR